MMKQISNKIGLKRPNFFKSQEQAQLKYMFYTEFQNKILLKSTLIKIKPIIFDILMLTYFHKILKTNKFLVIRKCKTCVILTRFARNKEF